MGSFAVKCVPLTVMTFGFMMRNSLTFRPQSSIQRFPPQATHLLPVNHQVLVHKIPSITVHASDRFRPGAAAAAAAVGGSSSPTVLNNPYQQPNTVNNVNKNNGWNNDGYCCPCSSCCACRIDMGMRCKWISKHSSLGLFLFPPDDIIFFCFHLSSKRKRPSMHEWEPLPSQRHKRKKC